MIRSIKFFSYTDKNNINLGLITKTIVVFFFQIESCSVFAYKSHSRANFDCARVSASTMWLSLDPWKEYRLGTEPDFDIMDVASSDYLKTALYSGDNGPDTGNRDSLRLMELGLHLESLHDGSHRINTSVDHLLNDPTLSGRLYCREKKTCKWNKNDR